MRFQLPFLICYCFFSMVANLSSQSNLEWLIKSEANVPNTTHGIYDSGASPEYYFAAGDFWPAIVFDDIELEGKNGTADGFVAKIDEEGNTVDVWHFESSNYVRINKIEYHHQSESMIIVGQFREDFAFKDFEIDPDYWGHGFVMSVSLDGDMQWFRHIAATNEFSFASGEGLAIGDNGLIYVGFEAFGQIELDNIFYTFEPESQGCLIIALDEAGDIIHDQQWEGNGFENIIDIVDLAYAEEGVYIAGGMNNGLSIGENTIDLVGNALQAYLIKIDLDLSFDWYKVFPGSSSIVNDLNRSNEGLLVSFQYRDFIEFPDLTVNGSGSWGDLLVSKLTNKGDLIWSHNLFLNQNGGSSGVYGLAMTSWKNLNFVGGMYQGVVNNEAGVVLDPNVGDQFQLPFMIALDDEGNLVEKYGFEGSFGLGKLRGMASNQGGLYFSGDFTQQLSLEGAVITDNTYSIYTGHFSDPSVSTLNVDYSNDCDEEIIVIADKLHVPVNFNLVFLFNVVGQKLIEIDRYTTDLLDLSSGTYFIVGKCDAGKFSKTIIR